MKSLLKKCIITGQFENSGLGFNCYKKASELKVNGELEYKSSTKASMILSGAEVESFIKWLKQTPGITLVNASDFYQSKKQFSEFIIKNTL